MLHPPTANTLDSGGGPMIPSFANPAHEAAFKQRYAEQRLRHDGIVLQNAPPLVLLAALRPLIDGDWQPVAISLMEAALFVLLIKALRRRPAAYLRHRSLLLSGVFLEHYTISRLISHIVVSPGCPGPLLAVWRELNLSQLPWNALLSLSLPLPARHAAVTQALLIALATAWLPSLRRDSFQLCPATQGHYQSAANGLANAAACLLPPPLGAALVQRAARLGPSAFFAVHMALQVAVNYGLVLAVICGWELQQRRAFARQRRLAADAAALVRAQRGGVLSLPLLALAFALLWAVLTLAITGAID
ncbi:zinc finger MYM-type 1-like [Chlorella sorokiniana]|uniref:Zinc finger MYM-type 1-like n=1 Tax=Chlorella sorokiniana TaxID=3076 RepID=A0A2P6TN15_CHLSO|nr:zinc finger MYM-type 1-like [Chlorella sorokiniana]|eukprot:PRW45721.1 zinc finger MYM-type 1-like [Chlorella sorokiniana]